MPDDNGDFEDFDPFGEEDPPILDDQESALVEQDLVDLDHFEATFGAEGYRGVAVYCHDCAEEHYYPWDMLRENLQTLLETGDTPVHEPAYEPDPHEYVPWDYARGYVDALHDTGAHDRREVTACPQCGLEIGQQLRQANFCPRCGTVLLDRRLVAALRARGLDAEAIDEILREAGLPR